jgi:AmmeMemoRadiSam system protein A/AmmeMemoRadiSam system protein B
MAIIGAFIMPHPPILLPAVGKGEEGKIQKTADACHEVSKRIAALKPDTIVLVSPHTLAYSDYNQIAAEKCLKGDMGRFRAPEIKVSIDCDEEFASAVSTLSEKRNLSAGTLGKRQDLDHGCIVPLFFIQKEYRNFRLVKVGLSGLSYAEHYKLGQILAEAAENLNRAAVVVASGDLSHKAAPGSPYGFSQVGARFDHEITTAMAKGDFIRWLETDPGFADEAAECGLRSFIIMAGALDGFKVNAELLSYQNNFGIGYAVAAFIPLEKDKNRCFLDNHIKKEQNLAEKHRINEDNHVRLARYSVEYFVKNGKRPPLPDGLPPELTASRAGVFVSIKKQGQLRGCIGTISPVRKNIAEEIIYNAICACSEDPRFSPVRPDELSFLVYSVDVLSAAEPADIHMLDPQRYGVIVSCGRRRGLLLPALEGVDTVQKQIRIALSKANIKPDEPYLIERFEVMRHL